MTEKSIPKSMAVTIMEREYRVACPEGAEQDLARSAEFLNKKMKEIRATGKVYDVERVAVMAALNLTNELLNQGNSPQVNGQAIESMIAKIDQALAEK